MTLLDVFKGAARNDPAVPAADQDFVEEKGVGYYRLIANFREIIRDGKIPNGAGTHNYSYDPDARDSFNAALKQIEDNTAARIQNLQKTDSSFRALMEKLHWAKDDRDKYDEKVAQIISDEVDKHPALKNYRTPPQEHKSMNANGLKDIQDVTSINDLSKDIDSGKSEHRFDCGVMTLTEGIVRQRIEDNHNFLPKSGAVDDYKQDMAFHYAHGGVSGAGFFDPADQGRTISHAFMLTPTMQAVEGTANNGANPFKRIQNGVTFEQFANGRPLVMKDGTVYGGHYTDYGQHESFRAQMTAVDAGLREDGRTFSLQQLQAREKIPGFSVTTASSTENKTTDKPDIVMIASRTKSGPDEKFEMEVYRIHDVGTAQEGYSMIGYQAAAKPQGTADARLSDVIKDDKGHTFKFDADFSKNQIKSDVYQRNGYLTIIHPGGFRIIAETVRPTSPNPTSTPPQAAPRPSGNAKTPTGPSREPPQRDPSGGPSGSPHSAPKTVPADLAKIQQGLKDMGLYKGAANGVMNPDTQAALQNVIVRAQMSDTYKSLNGRVEGIYGPKTQKAFEEMAAKGQMPAALMNAIHDMNAKGALRTTYAPHNVRATAAAIRKDAETTNLPNQPIEPRDVRSAMSYAETLTKAIALKPIFTNAVQAMTPPARDNTYAMNLEQSVPGGLTSSPKIEPVLS